MEYVIGGIFVLLITCLGLWKMTDKVSGYERMQQKVEEEKKLQKKNKKSK